MSVMDNKHMLIYFQVYDHDWGLNDDFLGQAKIDLSSLLLDQ